MVDEGWTELHYFFMVIYSHLGLKYVYDPIIIHQCIIHISSFHVFKFPFFQFLWGHYIGPTAIWLTLVGLLVDSDDQEP